MPTRRQEKIARSIRDSVSEAIANHLSDPRLEEAFISVTRVEVSADLRIANVYISLFGGTEKSQKNTFAAIMHARSRIQTILAERTKSRFCPVLNLHRDEQFKKALETMKLIEKISQESGQSDKQNDDEDSIDQEHQ
jgi:ribosome-binding factor A